MKFTTNEIPQADRLEKVILAVVAINNKANTESKIAGAIGFSERQARYYRHAAEVLGFIVNDKNNAVTTDLGKELAANIEKRLLLLRMAINKNSFFSAIIDHFKSKQNGLTEDDLKEFVLTIADSSAHSTVPRRIKTILSWLEYVDIIIEIEDKYEINSALSTSEEKPDRQDSIITYLDRPTNKTLQEINVNEISPNPHNPRLIFDTNELDELKGSIAKVGILVPLTVYRNNKSFPKTEFVLLDGERRWRCAKELNIELVPANVIDEPKDITQNILFMFNIHHFRKEWALFPTALKLDVIIEKIGSDQESVLAEFTGVSRTTIRRCKALLWYPTKYRDVLMEKSGRISTDFFIELFPIAHRLSHEEKYFYPSGTEIFIDGCISKFNAQKHILDVKEFREMRKTMGFLDKSGNFPEFIKKVDDFISNDVGLEMFTEVDIEEEATRKNIIRYVSYLNSNLENINPDFISDISIEEQLKLLKKRISIILEAIE